MSYIDREDFVLDIGCGPARLSIEIANRSKRVNAIDISRGMIEVAQEVVRKSDIHKIEFHHGNIFDPNLIDGSFNVIIGFNVLHYVQDPGKALDRITKLLVPGGLFISSTGCIKESKAGFKSLIFLLKKSQITPPMTPFSHKK